MATKKKKIPRSTAAGAMPVRIVGWSISKEEIDNLVNDTFRIIETFMSDPRRCC